MAQPPTPGKALALSAGALLLVLWLMTGGPSLSWMPAVFVVLVPILFCALGVSSMRYTVRASRVLQANPPATYVVSALSWLGLIVALVFNFFAILMGAFLAAMLVSGPGVG